MEIHAGHVANVCTNMLSVWLWNNPFTYSSSLPIYRKTFKGKSYYFCCSELQNACGITLQISYRCLTMYYKIQKATGKFCFCRITTLQRLANTCMHVQVYNLNLLITKQTDRDTAVIQNLTVIQFVRSYSIHHAQHSEIHNSSSS